MKLVPVVKCSNLERSIRFYTEVLDFRRKYPDWPLDCGVCDLLHEAGEVQLSIHAGDGHFGSSIIVRVPKVDELFAYYVARGLDITSRPNSPIHCGPTNQTWGVRTFAATDPDGNSMHFGSPIIG